MEDLRTRKTKAAIEQAMLELIEIKGFSTIRLTEIANRAMVNRNTIYLHYESKEDIVMSILNNSYGASSILFESAKLVSSHISKSTIKKTYTKLLDSINSNIELYRIVLTDPGLNGYMSIMTNKIKEIVYRQVKPTSNNKIIVEYIVSGIYGVITRWIIYATGSIADITNELTELTYSNLRRLKK